MAANRLSLTDPKALGLMAGIFFFGLFLYLLLYLYPAYKTYDQSRQSIVTHTAELDRIRLLFPVQARAKALEKIEFSGTLAFPARTALAREKLPGLYARLSEIARARQLSITDNEFDVNALENDSRSLLVMLRLEGRLPDLRLFIIDLAALDFLDAVEMLQITPMEEDTKQMALNVRILIQKGGS